NLNVLDGKTAEQHVAIDGSPPLAGLANVVFVADRIGQVLCLVLLTAASAQAGYFLERDDIGPEFAQHLRHAVRTDASVHAATLVSVVSCNAENRVSHHSGAVQVREYSGYCSRAIIQPTHSCARSKGPRCCH